MATLRPAVNRADLLACLAAGGKDNLARTARLAGFAAVEPTPKPEARSKQEEAQTTTAPASEEAGHRPRAAESARVRFYYVVAREVLAPEESVTEEPAWFREARPLNPEQQRGRADWQPPAPAPLTPWRRLWPMLRQVLGAPRRGLQLDLRYLLEQLSRGRQPRRVPWQYRHRWTAECLLIIDYAPRLSPFWEDFQGLRRGLHKLRGEQGLITRELDGGQVSLSALPPPGTPVLILSDLGLHDSGGQARKFWAGLGRRLRAAGLSPIALLPAAREQWRAELAPWFYPLYWDRDSRFPRQPRRRVGVEDAPPSRHQTLERLLTLLAPAVRVEAGLLRAVRYLETDAGAREEAEVWHHPHTRACLSGFALSPRRMR